MKKCSKCCKGVRAGSLENLQPCSSVNFTGEQPSLSSPSIPTGAWVGGPESGDRVQKRRNATPHENQDENQPKPNTSEKARLQNNPFFEDDEDDVEFPEETFLASLRSKGYRELRECDDFNVGSQTLTRSMYFFGAILLIGFVCGYFVALSNTGRIQVLENEILEMKQALRNKSDMANDHSTSWFSGTNFGNLFGFWDSAADEHVDGNDEENLEFGTAPKWYERFLQLVSWNSTKNVENGEDLGQ